MRSVTDIAWLAGLYEGEGTLALCRSHDKRIDKTYFTWQFAIQMTDEDVVRRAQKIGGFGRVREVKAPSVTGKPVFRWDSKKCSDIQGLMTDLYPYLGERRRAKVDEFFEAVEI